MAGLSWLSSNRKLLDVNMLLDILIKPLLVHHIRFEMVKSVFTLCELQGQSSKKVEERVGEINPV